MADKRDMGFKDMEAVLDRFSQRYNGSVEVRHETIDVTGCFFGGSQWKGPKGFGYDGSTDFKVIAATAAGHAFVQKYAKDKRGHVAWTKVGGRSAPALLPLDDNLTVITTLCLAPLKNTSLYEVYDVMKVREEIQGFKRWHLRNIVERLRQHYGSFDPEKDSAFMFAGSNRQPHAELHNLWLEQIIQQGRNALYGVSEREAGLMAAAFNCSPNETVTYEKAEQFGYRLPHGSSSSTRESVLFLYRKLQAFQKFTQSPQ